MHAKPIKGSFLNLHSELVTWLKDTNNGPDPDWLRLFSLSRSVCVIVVVS